MYCRPRFARDRALVRGKGWEFIYQDSNGEAKRDGYRYVVNARGQAKSIRTDPSLLTKNPLKRGIVQNEETQPVQPENRQSNRYAEQPETKLYT